MNKKSGKTSRSDIADPPNHLTCITAFGNAVKAGQPWLQALFASMSEWTISEEIHDGRQYRYLLLGEAFDWLTLAERLTNAVSELLPHNEVEELLFSGTQYKYMDMDIFKTLIGPTKYSGYLNYYYGVIIEQALQISVELDIHKRHLGNGKRYIDDFTEETFLRLYRESYTDLFARYIREAGRHLDDPSQLGLADINEFTYWLFKLRIRKSHEAKVASDTDRGLRHLRRIGSNQNQD